MASWQHEPQRVGGVWTAFRQVSPTWPPLVQAAGAPHPEQESGRWHRYGETYAQYLSLNPWGAWSELVRYHGIRDEALAREQRRNLWLVTVEEHDLADLRSFQAYDKCGLDPALAAGAHAPAQLLADELRDAGYRGLLSPSAALPGAVNLTLFGERYELPEPELAGLDPDLWLIVELVAQEAWPPLGLLMTTCHQGQPHAGLERHLAGGALPSAP